MKIFVDVFYDRSLIGKLSTRMKSPAAKVCEAVGMSLRKEDDLPAGEYSLFAAVKIPAECLALRLDLGPKVLVFQSIVNPEFYFGLHGGMPDSHGAMRETDGGGLRVHNEDLLALCAEAKAAKTVSLHLETRKASAPEKLSGKHASDTAPSVVLREKLQNIPQMAGSTIGVGEMWGLFLRHHAALGCALCRTW